MKGMDKLNTHSLGNENHKHSGMPAPVGQF